MTDRKKKKREKLSQIAARQETLTQRISKTLERTDVISSDLVIKELSV